MWNKLKNSKQSTRVVILLGVIAVFVMMIAFSGNGDATTNTKETAEEVSKQVVNKTIDLNDELAFQNFKLTMNSVIIYEEDGVLLADISFDWLNQSFDGETTFLRAAGIDVRQGSDGLTEITNAYQDPKSDVHFPNAVGGQWKVNLTYELKDDKTPIDIIFITHDEHDKNQELTLKIN